MTTLKSFAGLLGMFCLIGGLGAVGAYAQAAPGSRVESCRSTAHEPKDTAGLSATLATMKDKIAAAGYTLIESGISDEWPYNYAAVKFASGPTKYGSSCETYVSLTFSSADVVAARMKETSAALTSLGWVVIDSAASSTQYVIIYLSPAALLPTTAAAQTTANLAVKDAAARITAASQIAIP